MALGSEVEPYPELPCGQDPVEVWDASRLGALSPHQAACPWCGQVAEQERALRPGSAALAAEPVPSARLLPGVLSRVRAELRQGAELPLPSAAGPASVSERALVEAVRAAADAVGGVQVRGVRVLAGPPLRAVLGLGVPLGRPVAEAAGAVRAAAQEALAGWGLVAVVDVAVEDVL